MASIRSWIRQRWPARDDVLLIDVKGSDKRLRPFLKRHSLAFGMVRRDGDLVAFRAFVPEQLRRELAEHASATNVVLNASAASERIHAATLTRATTNRFLQGALPPGAGLVPLVTDPLKYWTVDEVDTVLCNLETRFAGVASRIPLPHVTADKGKKCWALRLGLGAPDMKDTLVVLGAIHGSEWGSCECIGNFATDILTASEGNGLPLEYRGVNTVAFTAAEVTSILQKMDIVLFPLVNRDGREHSQATLTLWRKNRNERDSGGLAHKVGVDLNRNFDFLHDFQQAFDSSLFGTGVTDPAAENYRGTGPFSEPEALNVEFLLDSLPTAKWLVDLHSPWQTVLHPWGDDDIQTDDPDMNFKAGFTGQRGLRTDRLTPEDSGYREYMPEPDMQELERLSGHVASAMTQVNNRVHTEFASFAYGTFFGMSIDYAHARHHVDSSRRPIYPLHVEWGNNTLENPDWSDMEGKYMPEVVAGLVSLCLNA
jgi:murein tripeptide amidase MpaA